MSSKTFFLELSSFNNWSLPRNLVGVGPGRRGRNAVILSEVTTTSGGVVVLQIKYFKPILRKINCSHLGIMSVLKESNDSFRAAPLILVFMLDLLLIFSGLLSSSLSLSLSNEVIKSSLLFEPPKLPSDKGFAGEELFLF